MKLQLPTWKPWYRWQAVTLATLIANVLMALYMPAFSIPAVNWFAVGVMTAQLFSNHIIYGALDANRRMMQIVDQMGQLQMEEIGKHIAVEMHARMTGDTAAPLAPTKH